MAAFANLTEDERERLEMLVEEAGEIITIATKILRHGYANFHPANPLELNRQLLEKEIKDLCTVIHRMNVENDIFFEFGDPDYDAEWRRKLRWARHQAGSPQ